MKNKNIYNQAFNGSKLDLLTSFTSSSLSLTLFLRVSISANRTTINAMCSFILFWRATSSENLSLN